MSALPSICKRTLTVYRYDRSQRRVSFWASATTDGTPLTVLDNLPNEDLLPFIGVYGNSVEATEVRFCDYAVEEEKAEESPEEQK